MSNAKAGWCVATVLGLLGGSWVGIGMTFVGAPWKMVALCGMLGVAIATLLYTEGESSSLHKSLFQLFRMGRSLAVGFRLFFSSLLIIAICIIYSGSNEMTFDMAFALFLIPIIASVLLFGGLFASLIPILSSIALFYYVIPPKNSFAIVTIRDFLDLCLFVSLALITWATITAQTIFSGIEDL